MNFIDLETQQKRIRKKIDQNIKNVLDSGQYIMGKEISLLEETLKNYIGTKYCITVSSGTDALLIALMALDIRNGDEVITSPFTFFATAEVISLLGAKPIFVDIDPKNYNLDSSLLERAITEKTRAIMPVSMFGQCADFDTINEIASHHNIPVIEDAAQSFGATYKGQKSCSLSSIGCTSFFPSKPLGGYGDSGACFTDDDELAEKMSEIRVHGQSKRYTHSRLGLNARMDTIQAAILLAKFEIFPEEVLLRAQIGKRYSELIDSYDSQAINLSTPIIEPYNTSVFAQYTLRSNSRAVLIEKLNANQIPTAIHYPNPVHKQEPYIDTTLDLAESEMASKEVFSLPMHPYLTEDQQREMVEILFS
tara:strand:+ start:1924 stop:3015 length:1092 start_codon:yes stop_codon:yes gene_type:complete